MVDNKFSVCPDDVAEVPDPKFMLGLQDELERAKSLDVWFKTICRLAGGALYKEDDDEFEGDAAVKQKKAKVKMSLKEFHHSTAGRTYPLEVADDLLEELDVAEKEEEEDRKWSSDPVTGATVEAPNGFCSFGQIWSSCPQPQDFQARLTEFVNSNSGIEWSDAVAAEIGKPP